MVNHLTFSNINSWTEVYEKVLRDYRGSNTLAPMQSTQYLLFYFLLIVLLLPSFLPDCQPNKMWGMSLNPQIYMCLLM